MAKKKAYEKDEEFVSMDELLEEEEQQAPDYLPFLDQLEELPTDVKVKISQDLIKQGYEDPKRTCILLGKSLVNVLRGVYFKHARQYGDGYSLVNLYQYLSIKG